MPMINSCVLFNARKVSYTSECVETVHSGCERTTRLIIR